MKSTVPSSASNLTKRVLISIHIRISLGISYPPCSGRRTTQLCPWRHSATVTPLTSFENSSSTCVAKEMVESKDPQRNADATKKRSASFIFVQNGRFSGRCLYPQVGFFLHQPLVINHNYFFGFIIWDYRFLSFSTPNTYVHEQRSRTLLVVKKGLEAARQAIIFYLIGQAKEMAATLEVCGLLLLLPRCSPVAGGGTRGGGGGGGVAIAIGGCGILNNAA